MRIVYTYGVFDLLHPGHILLLERARALGDYLIVGIVSDEVIRRSKGNGRPINTELERAQVVKALRCVDRVVHQGESDPTQTLVSLNDSGVLITVIVHGDDFFPLKDTQTVKKMGIDVVSLSYSTGYSTTKIIKKIKSMGDLK